MYNPHLLECGVCLQPFKDGEEVAHWFEDYVHTWCAPTAVVELGTHIWREKPENPFRQEVKT